MTRHATLRSHLLVRPSTPTQLSTSILTRNFIANMGAVLRNDICYSLCRNVLSQGAGAQIPSDNVPDTPIFRHNATAVASVDVRNSLAAFRTSLGLFSTVKGRSDLSTLQKYPFDE